MKQNGLPLDHGVLPRAKVSQLLLDKVFQPLKCSGSRHGNPKLPSLSGMIGEKAGNVFRHRFDDRILDRRGKGRDGGIRFRKFTVGLAILIVEVPVASFRFAFRIDKNISFRPKTAVVGLHEKMLFALGPGGELFAGNEELGAGVGVNRNPELLGKSRKGVKHVVLVGIEKMDFSDLMFLNPV